MDGIDARSKVVLSAFRCESCRRVFFYERSVEDLRDFASSLPADTVILPELGILTSAKIEIFASTSRMDLAPVSVSDGDTSIVLHFGSPSDLFAKSLYYITRWAHDEYGHDVSWTLTVEPPPPYSIEQRRTIQLLFSRLSREAKSIPQFWSGSFVPEDPEDDGSVLSALTLAIEGWRLDTDRHALSLANRIVSGSAQGPFVNIYRLLELFLRKMEDDELIRVRFDERVSHSDFQSFLDSREHDLASRLRRRIHRLSTTPLQELKNLWSTVAPGQTFDVHNVFGKIAKLRNQNVHAHEGEMKEEVKLPWEELSFERATLQLADLLLKMLTTYEADVAATPTCM